MKYWLHLFFLPALGCTVPEDTTGQTSLPLDGRFSEVQDFGENPGDLAMYLYAPAGVSPGSPLVFAFHGCSQGASGFRDTGWEALADKHSFYVVYPEQNSGNNLLRCFNWFEDQDLTRGEGENRSVASMVQYMRETYEVDPDQIFASGFSAGAAMVAVVLATWPDLFAGGGIHSGVPYRCAESLVQGFSCMNIGRDRESEAWGDLVRQAFPDFAGPYPKVSIWHGSSDYTVNQANQRELTEQWIDVHETGPEPSVTEESERILRKSFEVGGEVVVEEVTVLGMGHALAVDPKTGCGQSASYQADVGVCAARRQASFFGLDR